MADYKHILVATDLHKDSLPVVNRAVSEAKKNNAKLSVITVVPNVPYYMASGLASISDVEDQLEDSSRKRLESAKAKIDMDAKFYVKHGSAKLEIVRVADKLGADLIVIGSHGRHGVQRLLGSTASGVLHRADQDVLVVRARG